MPPPTVQPGVLRDARGRPKSPRLHRVAPTASLHSPTHPLPPVFHQKYRCHEQPDTHQHRPTRSASRRGRCGEKSTRVSRRSARRSCTRPRSTLDGRGATCSRPATPNCSTTGRFTILLLYYNTILYWECRDLLETRHAELLDDWQVSSYTTILYYYTKLFLFTTLCYSHSLTTL